MDTSDVKTIINNIVTGNNFTNQASGIEIYVLGDNGLISGNTVTDNTNAQGIYIDGNDQNPLYTPNITDNTLTGNYYGVYITSHVQPEVHNNNIYNNTQYDFYNETVYDIDARFNWWGDTATVEIETGGNPKNISTIYDFYDNSSYGMVNYSGWQKFERGKPPIFDVTINLTSDPIDICFTPNQTLNTNPIVTLISGNGTMNPASGGTVLSVDDPCSDNYSFCVDYTPDALDTEVLIQIDEYPNNPNIADNPAFQVAGFVIDPAFIWATSFCIDNDVGGKGFLLNADCTYGINIKFDPGDLSNANGDPWTSDSCTVVMVADVDPTSILPIPQTMVTQLFDVILPPDVVVTSGETVEVVLSFEIPEDWDSQIFEQNLQILYYDDTAGSWNSDGISNIVVNWDLMTITFQTSHTSKFAASSSPFICTDADGDGYSIEEECDGEIDCDDNNFNISPGIFDVCGIGACERTIEVCVDGQLQQCVPGVPTEEVCDGEDNDCDGQADEGVAGIYYRDADGDGLGNPNDTARDCSAPAGYVSNNTDSDDDADGLPDSWEYEHFGDLSYGPTDDPDGDGYDNITEYTNGWNPLVDSSLTAGEQANDLLTMGRLSLTDMWINSDYNYMKTANNRFKAAQEIAPDNQAANFFYAVTRIAALFFDSELHTLMDRAFITYGRGEKGDPRDLFNPTADFQRDLTGEVILPSDVPTSQELLDWVNNTILPEVEGAIANLDKINSDFNLLINQDEIDTDIPMEADYGDVLACKTALVGFKGAIKILNVYNLSLDIDELIDWARSLSGLSLSI